MEVRGSLSADWCTISCYRPLVMRCSERWAVAVAVGAPRGRLPCLQNRGGDDDLPCSRNARPPKDGKGEG
jgi:hypothetical protein